MLFVCIISINYIDTHNSSFAIGMFKFWLQNVTNYEFVVEEIPDYLIYDMWGTDHLNQKYNNSIKIALYTENYMPDLNHADYALSQAHIMYIDRYFKYSSFIRVLHKIKRYDIEKIRKESIKNIKSKKFCAAVISSNSTSEYFRFEFINELNRYKKIDMGGRAFNNIGGRVKDKIKFLTSYKFSFSMENTKGDGYVTEKIIHSLCAGTIPIYYGDYMVDEFINPKAYILVKDKQDIKNKIEYHFIKFIEMVFYIFI